MKVCSCYNPKCEEYGNRVAAQYSYGGLSFVDKVLCVVTLGFYVPIALLFWATNARGKSRYVCPECLWPAK